MYLSYSELIVAYPRNDHGISHPGRPGTVRVEQTILAEPGAIVSWSFWSRNGEKTFGRGWLRFFNGENHLLSLFDIIKGQSGEIDAESSNRQLYSCSNSC